MSGALDLEAFVDAQDPVWDDVIRELRAGRKETHWIWFVFPQIAGLGASATSRRFALDSVADARAYLAHPLLGPRLLEAVQLVLAGRRRAAEILGALDATKLRSCLTLFLLADPANVTLRRALDGLFAGESCACTEANASRRPG